MNKIIFKPQEGFQEKVLSCPADVAITGGSSGPGKTWCLLYEPLRHYKKKGFSATIFRRTYPQIENAGGMWDKSLQLYPYFGAQPTKSKLEWAFKDSRFLFRHMQNEDDWINYQGTEMPFIGFDELTQFERKQFTMLLTWNRSNCGVKPYIRATCNPDPDSFVAEMIDWYLDDEGFIHPDRDGKIRYFTTIEDQYVWGDSKNEVYEKAKYKLDLIPIENKHDLIKSFTFIKGDIYQNKILLKNDPSYLANLLALGEDDQNRYLRGNWKVKIAKDVIINYSDFQSIFTNDFVRPGKRCITADIATTGRDLLIIMFWNGLRLEDIDWCASNSGKEALDKINAFRIKYKVQNNNILFDADGVGQGLTGFISNCVEFHGGKVPFFKENYKNLKSQLYFYLSYCINQTNGKSKDDMIYVIPDVANKIFNLPEPSIYKGKTVKWILEHQMKAIRKNNPDTDGKLSIIPKDEQKSLLGGISPDLMDNFMENMYFHIKQSTGIQTWRA